MSNESKDIKCPHCGKDIDIQSALHSEIESKIKKQHEQNTEERLTELKEKYAADLKHGKDEVKQALVKEFADSNQAMQEELTDKSNKIQELNLLRTQKAKLVREKEELSAKFAAQYEETLNEKLKEKTEEIVEREKRNTELLIKDKERALEGQKSEVRKMQQRLEQGSMQVQGETQELAIEEWLKDEFVLDDVAEIKKGQTGADCLQTVNSRERINCGTIYYESKRTKAFQSSWIEKFKTDIREKNATFGVLVTQARPAGKDRLYQEDGIWICSFEEFKGLSRVLRETVIKLSSAKIVQANRGNKMGLLYDFLTGDEFRANVEAIVDGFTSMQASLNSEKTATLKLWKQREQQIAKVILNTSNMYGSIQGIAGTAVADIPQLELDPGDLLIDSSDEIAT
jgi:hypothetical protein